MRDKQVNVGDIVVLNNLADATPFEVLAVDGFVVTVREAGTEYKPQFIDKEMIYKGN